MMKRLILPLLVLAAIFYFMSKKPVRHGPGVMAPDEPSQTDTDADPFEFNGFKVIPLADFQLRARVLSKERYRSGPEAELAPWDIAFGWGPMSDESILKEIDISQSNRFYYWKVREFPIPRRDIESSSANMHLIPADDDILDLLDDVREGEILDLFGHLVRVEGPRGWYWKSSLTRQDTGAGACEVIFVTELSVAADY